MCTSSRHDSACCGTWRASTGCNLRYGVAMTRLLTFPGGTRRDADVIRWFTEHPGPLGEEARRWFDVFRACGPDVVELLHDGHPTVCVGDVAFGYVNAFTAHVNVGFFLGAELADPSGLLQGTGKFMRHVKVRPGEPLDETALRALITAAHSDIIVRTASRLRQEIT